MVTVYRNRGMVQIYVVVVVWEQEVIWVETKGARVYIVFCCETFQLRGVEEKQTHTCARHMYAAQSHYRHIYTRIAY